MSKQKTRKTMSKRMKVTANGKVFRRHQLGSGHLKSHKSSEALASHSKETEYYKGEVKSIKRGLGI